MSASASPAMIAAARVAYRLALDHPERIEKLAVLDIVPTGEMWRSMDAARAMAGLSLDVPRAARTAAGNADRARGARIYRPHAGELDGDRSLDLFRRGGPRELSRGFRRSARIHAICEDYRAGATIDRANDSGPCAAGRKIAAPLLALWGDHGIPAAGADPLDIWRRWASDASGHGVACGHFVPEEAPEATQRALVDFFT